MKNNKIKPTESAHSFFIPVMGTGFTIDTPLKIARYGVSSVISLVDDTFIEQMRKYHCQQQGIEYEEISRTEDDHRARRITAYLNLLDQLIKRQVEELQASPFEPGSEITRYFDLLPDSELKDRYNAMLKTADPGEKKRLQESLRSSAVPGTIDTNIMTKLDRTNYSNGEPLPPEFSDAKAALRGYANSTLCSSIILSAGLNPPLYTYIAGFRDFFPDESGFIKKKIVLKVSDYRSAVVQARFLAKKGLWVSEYRVESGLNCGGHAFAAKGQLMGPILDEFTRRRQELSGQTLETLKKALGDAPLPDPEDLRITVAGGIGTFEEQEFLRKHYNLDRTGWGTPFLLVPEVTNVDNALLEKLCAATEDDVFLSAASPMLVPFWNLRSSPSEEARRKRIEEKVPGSSCKKGHAALFNTEFTQRPVCVSARAYVAKKLEKLDNEELTEAQREWMREDVLAKSCICHELSGGATLKYGIDPQAAPAVCPGPAIANYSKIATLEEMMGHIYGRLSLLTRSDRPHMFIKEMSLYIEYVREEFKRVSIGVVSNAPAHFQEFKENLLEGIDYYRKLAELFVEEKRKSFLDDLQAQKEAIERVFANMPAEMEAR